jgi:transcriptional regulator with XRE-family HTH domain
MGRQKKKLNLALKMAILRSGRTQRRLSVTTSIGEVRLSHIVQGVGAPPTESEKRRLARALDVSIASIFPETVGIARSSSRPRR